MSEFESGHHLAHREYHVRLGPVLDLLTPVLRHAEPVLAAAAHACGASSLDRVLLLVAVSLLRHRDWPPTGTRAASA